MPVQFPVAGQPPAGSRLLERGEARPSAVNLRFVDLETVFGRYLSCTPLAYSLFRASECAALAKVRIPRPVLDVGCSVGEFAAFALQGSAAQRACDVGVDLLGDRLRLGKRRRGHALLAQSDAAALPIADESFASVLAVSVCEHFTEPQRALAEAYRVLRPGGWFVATIVLADIHQHLFYASVFDRLGMARIAHGYRRLHDRVFRHVTLQSRADWENMLMAAGFRIVKSRKIVSPKLTRCFDFLLFSAWPYKMLPWAGIRPFVWRPKWLRTCCWHWFRSLIEEETGEGCTLLLVAEKPVAIERWVSNRMAQVIP